MSFYGSNAVNLMYVAMFQYLVVPAAIFIFQVTLAVMFLA